MANRPPDSTPDLGIEPTKFLASMLPAPPAAVRIDVQRGVVSLMQQRGRGEPKRPTLRAVAREAHATLTKTVVVRAYIAEHAEDREAARHLVRRRYAWRGYVPAGQEDFTPPEPQRREITFVASDGRATVGTITLGLDGPEGLLAESTHADVVQRHRDEGGKVCELTKLALAERVDSKAVLAALFSLTYATGKAHGITDVFIEVNPRHVGFYTRVLNFNVAASARICERVGAPSVLLWLRTEALEQRLLELTLAVGSPQAAAAA